MEVSSSLLLLLLASGFWKTGSAGPTTPEPTVDIIIDFLSTLSPGESKPTTGSIIKSSHEIDSTTSTDSSNEITKNSVSSRIISTSNLLNYFSNPTNKATEKTDSATSSTFKKLSESTTSNPSETSLNNLQSPFPNPVKQTPGYVIVPIKRVTVPYLNEESSNPLPDSKTPWDEFLKLVLQFMQALQHASNQYKMPIINSTYSGTMDEIQSICLQTKEKMTVAKLLQAVEIIDVLNRLRPKNIFLLYLPVLIHNRQKLRPVRRIITNFLEGFIDWTPSNSYTRRVDSLKAFISQYPERVEKRTEILSRLLTWASRIPRKVVDASIAIHLPMLTLSMLMSELNIIRFKYMPLRLLISNLRPDIIPLSSIFKPRNIIKMFKLSYSQFKANRFRDWVGGYLICTVNQSCALVPRQQLDDICRIIRKSDTNSRGL